MPELMREVFEGLVVEGLERISTELARVMDDVAVFVEEGSPVGDSELFGLCEGTPLTDRGGGVVAETEGEACRSKALGGSAGACFCVG